MAGLRAEMDAARLSRMTRNARTLGAAGHLRQDVTVEQAGEVMWTYSSPELYELLVLRRGWAGRPLRQLHRRGDDRCPAAPCPLRATAVIAPCAAADRIMARNVITDLPSLTPMPTYIMSPAPQALPFQVIRGMALAACGGVNPVRGRHRNNAAGSGLLAAEIVGP